jgi:hypothetical protein
MSLVSICEGAALCVVCSEIHAEENLKATIQRNPINHLLERCSMQHNEAVRCAQFY